MKPISIAAALLFSAAPAALFAQTIEAPAHVTAVTLFPWSKGKKSGVKVYLQAVQVMTHIAYSRGGVDAFDVHDIENPFA